MPALPQIEPDELITKYQLHPNIIDIIVEGEFDSDFLKNHLASLDSGHCTNVLSIDAVNITDDIVRSFKLKSKSNKNNVIAFALLLAKQIQGNSANAICIVDADCDRITNKIRSENYLHYTDFTCMEMYFFNTATLKKFLTFTCNLSDVDRELFISLAERILPVLFAARALNEELSLNVASPSYTSGLSSKSKIESFDSTKYQTVFFSNITSSEKKIKARTRFDEIFSKLPSDLRHKAHGHDFISLLFDFLWNKSSVKLHNKSEDVIKFGGRILGTAVDSKALFSTSLFSLLNSRISNTRGPIA